MKGYGRGRVEQAGESMELARRRRMWLVAACAALAVTLLYALFFGALAIVIAFWDTHRALAAAGVTCGFLVLAGVAAWVIHAKRRRSGNVFDWIARFVLLAADYRRIRR